MHPFQLDVKATAFQRKVWQALQQFPRGQTRSYQEIARAIEQPTAVRAVAIDCPGNPVAVAIPCHRVVRGHGHLAGYRWDLERKQRLLALERRRAVSHRLVFSRSDGHVHLVILTIVAPCSIESQYCNASPDTYRDDVRSMVLE